MAERLLVKSGKEWLPQDCWAEHRGQVDVEGPSTLGTLRLRSTYGAARSALRLTLGVLGLVLATAATRAQVVTAVPQLDMRRFTGVWYEVARIPPKKDKCVSDALAIYTAGDKKGRWAVVNSCKAKDGSINTKNGTVKRQDKSEDGRLKVAYTWPFYRKQWVLGVGPEYEWALVGSPNHKMLAVLLRTSTLGAEAIAGMRAKAAAEGFAVEKLVTVAVTR